MFTQSSESKHMGFKDFALRPEIVSMDVRWGVQNTVVCIDIDDGNEHYLITENVCVTNGTAGLKTGSNADWINVTNNIVLQVKALRLYCVQATVCTRT